MVLLWYKYAQEHTVYSIHYTVFVRTILVARMRGRKDPTAALAESRCIGRLGRGCEGPTHRHGSSMVFVMVVAWYLAI